MENRLFSIQRFLAYGKFNLLLNWRQYILMPLGAGFTMFAVILFALLDSRSWDTESWQGFSMAFFGVLGCIIIGNAYPFLRQKESVLAFNLLPVSNLEKYVFEVIIRFVAFIAIYPLVLSVFGNLAVSITRVLNVYDQANVELKYTFLSWSRILGDISSDELYMWISAVFFVFSVAFSGSVSFMKRPLIKTVVFVGIVVALIGYYFYFLYEVIDLNQKPFFEPYLKQFSKETALTVMASILMFMSVLAQTFTFFKLKEKEA